MAPNYGTPGMHHAPKKKRYGLRIVLGLLLLVIGMGACAAVMSSGDNTTSAGTSETTAPATKAPGVGDVVKDGKFSFKVTETARKSSVGTAPIAKKAQGQFLLVYVTVKNIGDESQTFSGDDQKLYADGKEYKASSEAAIYLGDSGSLYESINPGNTVNGVVLFDLPKGTTADTIELHDSFLSDGVSVRLS